LHHVVPISWAESFYHFKLLDNWQNMVYIDGYNHAKITQNRNRNVIMKLVNEQDMTLSDNLDNKVYLKYKRNLLYDPEKKSILYKYNNILNNTL